MEKAGRTPFRRGSSRVWDARAPSSRRPFAKVFELVPGALLQGRTRPDVPVGLSLRVETNRDRRFHYVDRVRSDADGRFSIRVPYANEGGPAGIDVSDAYALRCGLAVTYVSVTEEQVASGARIGVGDPCAPAPAENPRSPAPGPPRRP